jgi:hypothetical protein
MIGVGEIPFLHMYNVNCTSFIYYQSMPKKSKACRSARQRSKFREKGSGGQFVSILDLQKLAAERSLAAEKGEDLKGAPVLPDFICVGVDSDSEDEDETIVSDNAFITFYSARPTQLPENTRRQERIITSTDTPQAEQEYGKPRKDMTCCI